MSDRELIELAAKAAGYEPQGMEQGLMYLFGVQDGWNPLTDDGDALRLAVKIKRMPELIRDGSGVFCGYESSKRYHSPIIERFGNDPMAATRRAIVRAAAEVGRAAAASTENGGTT
jgi:hypothetical protein